MSTVSVSQLLQRGARSLESHSDSPRLDAELLLGKTLRLPRSGLIARGNDPVAYYNKIKLKPKYFRKFLTLSL